MTKADRSSGRQRAPHRSSAARTPLRGATTRTAPKATSGGARSPGAAVARRGGSRRRVEPLYAPGPPSKGRRLAVTYDLQGPTVRLGIIWAFVVGAVLALGRLAFGFPLLTLLFSACAAIAATQIVDAWKPEGRIPARGIAAAIALTTGISSVLGARALGGALVASAALAVVFGVAQATRRSSPLAATALVLQAALPVGLVAACIELTTRYEIGAVVILLAMVFAFDVGDFIVGSGAGSVVEGPLAGAVLIAMVAAVAALIHAPPFDGGWAWAFGALAMVACPAGQVAASWLLPDAHHRAGALRRLDSLLVLAPLWTVLVGLLVNSR